MNQFQVFLHPSVSTFLKDLPEKKRSPYLQSLSKLEEDPFRHRSGCDIKKLSGKKLAFRLRKGSLRFEYTVHEQKVLVRRAFYRERGY